MKLKRSSAKMDAVAVGPIDERSAYPVAMFLQLTGLNAAELETAVREGLAVREVGAHQFILGEDWSNFLKASPRRCAVAPAPVIEVTGMKSKRKRNGSSSVGRPKRGVWFNTFETAQQLGIAEQTLDNWRTTKRPDRPLGHRFGNRVWYREKAIDEWIESRREES